MLVLVTTLLMAIAFGQAPSSFSWDDVNGTSYLSTARNQNFPQVCNSGWAISATNVLSSRIKIQRGGAIDAQISPQVLLECDTLNFGCYSGDPRNAFRWISENNITDQTCNTYIANSSRQCNSVSKCQLCSSVGCKSRPNSKIYGINTFGNVAGEQNMMNEIYRHGPITCGIALTDKFRTYVNGVFQDTTGAQKIEHFVTIYGWDVVNDIKFWKGLNSWGTFWGETGTFRIEKGKNTLSIETQCAYAFPIDTWTDDVRNRTLGNVRADAEPLYLTNASFLTPHRNSKVPTDCSSSWALAVTTTLSDKIKLASRGKKQIILSPQVLLNCKVGTCAKGGTPLDAIQFIMKFGLPQESCQNYMGTDVEKNSCTEIQNCGICTGYVGSSTCTTVKSPKRWRNPDYGALSGAQKMKDEISKWGPIICGLQVTESFFNYEGGIYKETTILPKINHYVEVIGFNEEAGREYWIARNFWGSAWGEHGFFRIAMNGNNLGIQTQCYFVGTPN